MNGWCHFYSLWQWFPFPSGTITLVWRRYCAPVVVFFYGWRPEGCLPAGWGAFAFFHYC
ncbi:hypothetical protein imdm_1274 [gamma proteobacterium IMCC2047]|nr:hypothetical protein imdm_1274 [gamma proteobacterium IMCC2047]